MSAGQLRGMETRIAEDMTSVLDFLSRLQGAIDDGGADANRGYASAWGASTTDCFSCLA